MKAKTVFIGIGIAIAGLALVGYNKVKRLQAAFGQMSIVPSDISNLKVNGLLNLSFNLSFRITNPTNEDFTISGLGMVTLKRIVVYRKGQFLASADMSIDSIQIPPLKQVDIKHVPFNIATINLIQNALTWESFGIDELTIEAVVQVLNTDYIIRG